MNGFYQSLFVAICFFNISFGVLGLGVNYGLLGDNLPPPDQVIGLLQSRNISQVRIFDPNHDVLRALEHSGIEVILGVRNEDLQRLSTDPSFAIQWVTEHVIPYVSSSTMITYIVAGNEVIPGPLATYVLKAMQNLDAALNAASLNIPVTSAVSLLVLGSSFPPSNGSFSEESIIFLAPIAAFLSQKGSPLLLNVYPFFAYVNNRGSIPLDYVLLEESATPIIDNRFQYKNMFEAMVDSVYFALDKVGGSGVEIVVSETGWPSGGGDVDATIANARRYVNNLVALELSGRGTPKRPGKAVATYIFALFNEDLKPSGVEQNFGLYHPDMTEVYHVNFPM